MDMVQNPLFTVKTKINNVSARYKWWMEDSAVLCGEKQMYASSQSLAHSGTGKPNLDTTKQNNAKRNKISAVSR